MTLTVALITSNEELNIRDCMENIRWADEIVVIDSGSEDQTQLIAREYTKNVYQIPFENFSKQKNEALARATMDWIFLIDVDERMTDELATEIKHIIKENDQTAVYKVHRRTFFFGKEMKYGGVQDDQPIRLFPKGKVSYERPVHEQIVTSLTIKQLNYCLLHYSTRDRAHYQQKLDCYIPFEVELMREKKLRVSFWKVYYRSIGKFFYLYFYKKGMLDGRVGFLYARLSAYYEFLKCRMYQRLK